MADAITPAVEEMEASLKNIDKVLTSSAKESFLLKRELLGINKIIATKNWEILSRFLSGTGAWRVLNKFKASILMMVQLASIQERAALAEAENMKRMAEVAKDRNELLKIEKALREAQTKQDAKAIQKLREMSDLFTGLELMHGTEEALDKLAVKTTKQITIMTGIVNAIGGKKITGKTVNQELKQHQGILESNVLQTALLAGGFALNAVNLAKINKGNNLTNQILVKQTSSYDKRMKETEALYEKYMALPEKTGYEKMGPEKFGEYSFSGGLIDAKGLGVDKFIQDNMALDDDRPEKVDWTTDIARDFKYGIVPTIEEVNSKFEELSNTLKFTLKDFSTNLDAVVNLATGGFTGLAHEWIDAGAKAFETNTEEYKKHRIEMKELRKTHFDWVIKKLNSTTELQMAGMQEVHANTRKEKALMKKTGMAPVAGGKRTKLPIYKEELAKETVGLDQGEIGKMSIFQQELGTQIKTMSQQVGHFIDISLESEVASNRFTEFLEHSLGPLGPYFKAGEKWFEGERLQIGGMKTKLLEPAQRHIDTLESLYKNKEADIAMITAQSKPHLFSGSDVEWEEILEGRRKTVSEQYETDKADVAKDIGAGELAQINHWNQFREERLDRRKNRLNSIKSMIKMDKDSVEERKGRLSSLYKMQAFLRRPFQRMRRAMTENGGLIAAAADVSEGIMFSIARNVIRVVKFIGKALIYGTVVLGILYGLFRLTKNAKVGEKLREVWADLQTFFTQYLLPPLEYMWEGIDDILTGFKDGQFFMVIQGFLKILGGMLVVSFHILSVAFQLGLRLLKESILGIWDWLTAEGDSTKRRWAKIMYVLAGITFLVAFFTGGWVIALAGVLMAVIGAFLDGMTFWADGGTTTGGLSIVGEKGPELVELPIGSRVHSNAHSKNMLTAGSSNTNNITVQVQGRIGASDAEVRDMADKVAREVNLRMNRTGAAVTNFG